MIKVGIVGISGYSGLTALEILLKHPQVRVTYVSANNTKGTIDEIWPHLRGQTKLVCDTYSASKAIEMCEVVFLAVPHTIAMDIAPELLKAKKTVIDLSADYRLDSTQEYKKHYGVEHKDPAHLKQSIYGLPELYREDIKKAKLIANPGCYPTAAILALAPIVSLFSKAVSSVIIDAKSGVSGAGRKATLPFSFGEVTDNFKAYKVLNHQHMPEMQHYLSCIANGTVNLHFVPHLLPVFRGILETIYVQLKEPVSSGELRITYERFYKTEPFIRILPKGVQPELKNVAHTNYCDIAVELQEDKNLVVITSAIDNLMKGAAGQAVQNMNIVCGFEETEALL